MLPFILWPILMGGICAFVWFLEELTPSSLREKIRLEISDAGMASIEDFVKKKDKIREGGEALIIVKRKNGKRERVKIDYERTTMSCGEKIKI